MVDGMTEQATAAPSRVLPFDVDHVFEGVLGGLGRPDRPPAPPAYSELEAEGLIAPDEAPYRWFSPEEAYTAEWLRGREFPVLSVQRREGQYLKTPDAVAVRVVVTIETKTADCSANAIAQRIRAGRKQARRVVLDLRGAGATLDDARGGLNLALGRYGLHLDEVLLVLADDLAVGWFHG